MGIEIEPKTEIEFKKQLQEEISEPEVFGMEKKGEHKTENIIKTINFLNSAKYRAAFGESNRAIKEAIKNIKEENDNFFIDRKIGQIVKKPLDNENWSTAMKRSLLKREAGNIKSDKVIGGFLLEKLENEALSDKEVNYIFNKYREFNPEYFYWLEDHDRRDDYHDQSLVNSYNIIPKLAEENYDKLRITRDCCYSSMSDKYAAIYTPQGNIDSFFQIDQELARENDDVKQKNGNISESNLEFFLNKFKKDAEIDNHGNLHYYLQIRKELPEELAEDIDIKLKLSISKELNRKFDSMDEFDGIIDYSGNEIVKYFKEIDKEKKEYLINSLESLLNRRKEEAGKKYFGYRSEDIELLDFYKSIMMHNPNRVTPSAHFTICYYLYLRKDLPENLVKDFEEKFLIEIPEKLKSFGDFGEYLDTPDKELLEPFTRPFSEDVLDIQEDAPDSLKKTISFDFVKMQKYLYDKINELDQKIKSTKIQPERLGIDEVLENEGFNRENMSEEDYDRMILTYKTLIELPMREKIENEFNIELKNFNIREQVQFVNFLSSKSIKEVEKVKEFLDQSQDEKAKSNRIRSFLSLESGGKEMGRHILNIGENLNPESADAVFAKYAEIISLTNKSREDLEEIFKDKKDVTEKEREKIIQNLMNKGNQLLIEFADKADSEKENKESETTLKELEKARTDLMFMASILKALKKEGNREDIDIENFKGVTFEKRTVKELTDGGKIMEIIDRICKETDKASAINLSEASMNEFLKNKGSEINEKDGEKARIAVRMMQMYHDNYRNAPEMQKILVEKFEKLLREGKDSTDIYALLKDGLPYAFCRFDDLENEAKYAASLNVDPKMQDSAIGKAFFEKCMENNKKFTVFGECSLIKPLVCTHIEKNGFVAYEVFDFSGELSVKIEKPGENKKTYYYKGLDKKEIIAEYENNFSDNKYNQNDSGIILKFEAESKELYEAIENLLNNGHYALTRYFSGGNKDKDGKREVYCAFERAGS